MMILDLETLTHGPSELGIAGTVVLELGDGRAPEAALVGGLQVRNLESRVLITGELRATGVAECARCLESFELSWDVAVEVVVMRDAHSEVAESDTLQIHQREGMVDLGDVLRESAVLAYPQSSVCRDDCSGLCVSCGADLNSGPCDCEKESSDPRWTGLP